MTDVRTALRRLDEEEARWRAVRDAFAGEHLHDETESESVGEVGAIRHHPADMGSETFEREKDLSLLEDAEVMLEEIALARARVEAGTYGLCAQCKGPVGDERLDAVPATRYCREHEARAEDTWDEQSLWKVT